jgi:hypothetical protein
MWLHLHEVCARTLDGESGQGGLLSNSLGKRETDLRVVELLDLGTPCNGGLHLLDFDDL